MTLKETCFPYLKKVHTANPNAIYIIVSRSRPTYSNGLYDKWFRALAPSRQLLHDYKEGVVSCEEYTNRFLAEIKGSLRAEKDILKIKEFLDDGKDVYLICWEKTGFCHRFLLMEMIEGKKKEKQATLGVNEYSELKKEFEAETDDLLNMICDTYHDELKGIADKYGCVTVSIKLSDDVAIISED